MDLTWYLAIGSMVGLYITTYIKKGIEGDIPPKAECEKKNVLTATMLEFGRKIDSFPPGVKLSLEARMPHSLIAPFTVTTFIWPLPVLLIITVVALELVIRIVEKLIRCIERLERKLEEMAKRQKTKKSEK